MDYFLMSIMLFSGLGAAACCILSFLDDSKKDQVLFRLWK